MGGRGRPLWMFGKGGRLKLKGGVMEVFAQGKNDTPEVRKE